MLGGVVHIPPIEIGGYKMLDVFRARFYILIINRNLWGMHSFGSSPNMAAEKKLGSYAPMDILIDRFSTNVLHLWCTETSIINAPKVQNVGSLLISAYQIQGVALQLF